MELFQPFAPSKSSPWDRRKAGHLLRRASFGPAPGDVERILNLGPEAAVDSLFQKESDSLNPFADQEALFHGGNEIVNFEASWLLRMLRSPHSLREKLCLFWHGHFATSQSKVQNARLMHQQNQLFLEKGMGRFEELLQAVAKDPAMVIWLDNETNIKGRPNENFARELMELFSLGIGNYSEEDIREGARSFTGWRVRDGHFFFDQHLFDEGEKQILGKKGRFRGEDFVSLCASQKSSHRFLSAKLLRFFVHPEPKPEWIEGLAQIWEKQNGSIESILHILFRSRLFFLPENECSLIKSPVEFVVGALRALRSKVNLKHLSQKIGEMGQRLYHPPTVKGWDGDRAWIHSATMLIRSNTAEALVREESRLETRFDPTAFFAPVPDDRPERLVDFAVQALLERPLPSESRAELLRYLDSSQEDRENGLRGLLRLILSSPEYHLN